MRRQNSNRKSKNELFFQQLVKRLSLSLAEAGFLNTLFGFLNLIVQPLAGYFSDRENNLNKLHDLQILC